MTHLLLGIIAADVVIAVFILRQLASDSEKVHGRAEHPRTRALATTASSFSPEEPMSFSDEEDERTLSQF